MNVANTVEHIFIGLVQYHNLPGRQARGEHLLNIGLKSQRIGGSLQDHRLAHALQRERGQQGGIGAPVAWYAAVGALAFGGAREQRGQRDVGATFIDKDELLDIQRTHLLAPGRSLLLTPFTGHL